MKRKDLRAASALLALALTRAVPSAPGAWNGAGVPGGTGGRDICDSANWASSVTDGDFSTITETNSAVQLVLSGDLARSDATVLSTNLTFDSGVSVLSVSHPDLAPGQLVSGAFISYNTMISSVDAAGGTVTLTQPTTGASAGTALTFISPALNFNFGVRASKASGVTVVIASDTPGVLRTVAANQRLVLSQMTASRNRVAFSSDVRAVFGASEGSVTRESGASAGGTFPPLLTLDGPLDLADCPGLAMNGGDLAVNGVISGAGKYMKMWSNPKTLTLMCPSNTFSGRVMVSESGVTSDDVLRFASVANAGQPSSLGTGSLITLGQPATGSNYLAFLGDSDQSSDKEIRLTGAHGNAFNRLLSSGDGTLTLAGGLTQAMTPAATSTRNLYFGGTGAGVFSGAASLTNVASGAAVGTVAVYKGGAGVWRLAGTNLNHEGQTHLLAGELVLDYGSYDQLAAASNAVVLRGGALTFRGRPAGQTADAVAAMRINDTAKNNYVCSRLTLDANGGDGFSLAVTNFSVVTPDIPLMYTLLDLSSSTNNALALANVASPITTAQRGELMFGPYNTQARFVLKTADGYCFPTTNSLGQVVPPSLTSLPTSGYSTGVRYLLSTPGTTTLAATGANIMSLTVDSNAGDVTLDAGAYPISPSGYAKGGGLLCRGTNNVAITGSSSWQCSMWSFFNFLDPDRAALQFDLTIGSLYTTWGGCGLTAYSGLGLGASGNFVLCGGIFRMTQDQTLSVGRLVLTDGGVFELGADLNGASAGDFSMAVGTGGNQVLLYGCAGFSAAGADRAVNLGGASAKLTWGANSFLAHVEGGDDGYALRLSSPRSDATVDFQNAIDLNGDSREVSRRTVEVADGAAAIDAVLSGTVTGSSTLVKAGAGTLKVTAAQSYRELRVCAGELLAADGCFLAADAVPVVLKAGATLGGVSGGSNAFGALTLEGDAVLDSGDGSAGLSFADSSGCDWGGATLTVKGLLQKGKIRFGTDASGLSEAQLARIVVEGDAVARIDENGYLVRAPRGTLVSIY